MKIKYNLERLQMILEDLSVLMGLKLTFLDTQDNYICHSDIEGDFCSFIQRDCDVSKKCDSCDKRILERAKQRGCFESHICHAGLYDAAMPVTKNGLVVGTIIMGRIRSVESPEVPLISHGDEALSFYAQLPKFSNEQIESLKRLLPNILFESAITLEYDGVFDRIEEYIKNNLKNKLGISELCSRFYISKTTLYDMFRKSCGMTVNEYITSVRINTAKELLGDTKITVFAVAEAVGVENYTYFSKLFKRYEKQTPTQYRKAHRHS